MNLESPFISPQLAMERLKRGDAVALPTETVYGLAASIEKPKGIEQIFRLKARPFFDPLIVHVADFSMVKTVAKSWPPIIERLCELFWPGPLTVVVEKQMVVSDMITSGLNTVAVRCPSHPTTLDILRAVGPVAAPSANRFGRTSPTLASHVIEEFGYDVSVVDGGPCIGGLESTIVQVRGSELQILRPGLISKAHLRQALTDLKMPFEIRGGVAAQTPGSLDHHYQPEIPLVLVENPAQKSVLTALRSFAHQSGRPHATFQQLMTDARAEIAARRLYAEMRELRTCDFIYVERTAQNSGEEWEGVWDRLTRASSFKVFCE
jgi:L-threonylcarbamoyladenylate synthase